jgi:hypothetical protein
MPDEHEEHDEQDEQHPGELHASPLSAADDERIRRLLVEARHTEPMPEDVAARLDRVLTGLGLERTGRTERDGVPAAPVVDLAARRRRTAANLLVAAAAVLVVGVGATQVLPDLGRGGNDSPSATTADQAEAGGAPSDTGGGSSSRGVQQPENTPALPSADGAGQSHAFRVRSARFGPDVRRIRDDVLSVTKSPAPLLDYPQATCVPPGTEESTVVAATYNGAPAALVLHPPTGDVQVVDLYLCGDTKPRRSITLTAP